MINPNHALRLLRADLEDELPFIGLAHSSEIGNLDSKHCAAVRLEQSLFKKYLSSRHADSNARAIEKWRRANDRCMNKFDVWICPAPVIESLSIGREFLYRLSTEMTDAGLAIRTGINPIDGKFGPGVTLASRDETLVAKLSRINHTFCRGDLISFYRDSLQDSPASKSAEQQRYKQYGYLEVKASKLTTVPKTDEIDRVICIEPLLNMFYQQAVNACLVRILGRAKISLSTQQQIQRDLAQQGSISQLLTTIDLSSASDTISLSFCEWFLPEPIMKALDRGRCKFTEVEGKLEFLHMISSMGNATTFPLETLVFLAISVGAMRSLGIAPIFSGENRNIGVYGDDIIVPTACFDLVAQSLQHAGFILNTKKTFSTGRFRESCGGDYLAGHDVTPVFFKDLLTSQPALFSAVNRLALWSCSKHIRVDRLMKYLLAQIKSKLRVPTYCPAESGLWTHFERPRRYKMLVPLDNKRTYVPESPDEALVWALTSTTSQPGGFGYDVAARSRITKYRLVKRYCPGDYYIRPPAVQLVRKFSPRLGLTTQSGIFLWPSDLAQVIPSVSTEGATLEAARYIAQFLD